MSRKIKKFFLQCSISIILLVGGQTASEGGTLTLPQGFAQTEFHELSQELGLAIHYIPTSPAEPRGIIGFDAGIEITGASVNTDNPSWQKVAPGTPGMLLLPKLRVQKGLPLGFDIGASYASVPELDITVMGAELKYALLSGNMALPALAIRGAMTQLTGLSTLDLNTLTLDLSVSKGIAFITPYAGVGMIQMNAKEKAGLNLNPEKINLSKGFAGVRITIAVINFIAEVDIPEAEGPLYTLRVNVGL